MRVGWLVDTKHGYKGGAELCSDELLRTRPADAQIVLMSPQAVHNNVDCFVIHNCYEYGSHIIPMLETRPVVKQVHDVWHHGDPALRRWLCQHSAVMILSSPIHREALNFNIQCPVKFLPNAIRADRLTEGTHEKAAVWLGRFEEGKGIVAAAEWAEENRVTLHWYGFGSGLAMVKELGQYCGQVEPENVHKVLGEYETFVFLPDGVEPYGRTVVEAWLAGCELVINGNVGAAWWIDNEPDAIERGSELFWELIRTVI